MPATHDNPYASPEKPGGPPQPKDRRRWSRAAKLALWALAFFGLTVASVVAGGAHYDYLARDFDYENGTSRELGQLTEPVKYWFIPALSCLLLSVLLGISAAVAFVAKLFR